MFSENGIIKKAQDAGNSWNEGIGKDQNAINDLLDQANGMANGPQDITTLTTRPVGYNLTAKDEFGNLVKIPKGFKVVLHSNDENGVKYPNGTNNAPNVQDGVVIEDKDGNQFVWVPVGEVNKKGGSKSDEIILGRYTFSTSSTGTPTLVQAAYTDENPTNYVIDITDNDDTNDFTIRSYHKELSTFREGVASDSLDGQNATAKDLAGFVNSVKKSGGYYIARYEASYGGGYNAEGSTDVEKYANAKPLSQVSTAHDYNMSYVYTNTIEGKTITLWNDITQINAAKVCRNMYTSANNVGVESDLVNSYMWDTAIVYIQEMGNTNYANSKSTDFGNADLRNTGTTSAEGETLDVKCNIYDMASNCQEWTTEHSTRTDSTSADPCTGRAGSYYFKYNFTNDRLSVGATGSYDDVSFRVGLYVK